eukprot:8643219-Pyramimonas_sp.AAC.1
METHGPRTRLFGVWYGLDSISIAHLSAGSGTVPRIRRTQVLYLDPFSRAQHKRIQISPNIQIRPIWSRKPLGTSWRTWSDLGLYLAGH